MYWKYRYSSSSNDTSAVVKQLAEDYPESSLEWVENVKWSGPEQVDIEDVDYSNYKRWAAFHDKKKVKKFERKISKGKKKPVVLIKTPKNTKYIVIDGHHRALAYRNLDRPLLAWVGKTKSETGPWDEFHAKQKHSENSDSTKATA